MAEQKKPWVARVELPRALKPIIKKAAKARGMTLQGVLEEALRNWLTGRQPA